MRIGSNILWADYDWLRKLLSLLYLLGAWIKIIYILYNTCWLIIYNLVAKIAQFLFRL